MEEQKFVCPYCGKKHKTKQACSSHKGSCKLNPNRRIKSQRWLDAMKDVAKKREAALAIRRLETCPFCNLQWETNKSGFGLHIKYCTKNPDRVDGAWKGRHHTDGERKKISEGAKKAHDEGRGHTWQNRYLNPSYAEQWLYDVLNNANIQYEKEKAFKGFFLDVVVGNKVIEIDGEQHYDKIKFPEQLERDKRKDALLKQEGFSELRLRWSEVRKDTEKAAQQIFNFLK